VNAQEDESLMNTTADDKATGQRTNSSRAATQALLRQFDERLANGGAYVTDAHMELVARSCDDLLAARCIAFTSDNHLLAQHNKELCINRLRAKGHVQLLFFDALSGPDLPSVINAELENLSLENMASEQPQEDQQQTSNKVLIVDSEDLVSNADWDLIIALGSQLQGACVGVLTLMPRDPRAGSPLLADSNSIERIEFLPPTEREFRIAEAIAKHSSRGEEVLALFESLGLSLPPASRIEVTQENLEEAAESKGVPSPSEPEKVSKPADHSSAAQLSFRLFLGLLIVEILVLLAMTAL
jgi:hypothetical protein